VLAAGVLLIAALIAFLARSKLKNPLNLKELPQRLGVNITQDASGFTLDHSMGGHSRYRIHASKVAQYKDNHAILHDVKIEIFGEDGSQADRIEGAEFEYDQKAQKVSAAGPVAITLIRPGVKPALESQGSTGSVGAKQPQSKAAEKSRPTPLASAKQTAAGGEIHVSTSGLTFDTKSGVATTAEHVDFSMVQGSGSSTGATYDSKGLLVLDKAVVLNTRRGGQPVAIHAEHAEFERESHLCRLHAATADYRGGHATAGDANVVFRDDGSAVRLDATNGFNLLTATGGHIAAPIGSLNFDEHNQPTHGRLEGGVRMDSTRDEKDGASQRRMGGSAPTADLGFSAKGELSHAHLERGVVMESETLSETLRGPLRVSRKWQSPVADIAFRDNGHGQAEPDSMHGTDGVVVTGESQRGKAAPEPSRLASDDLTGQFGPNSSLAAILGVGHASMEQTNAAGARQTSNGDKLEVQFAQGQTRGDKARDSNSSNENAEIQSASLDGHVELTQTPAAKPGAATPTPLRAWAGRADYQGSPDAGLSGATKNSAAGGGRPADAGAGWMHLTLHPRVEDGGVEITADKIDVNHDSGDALAHGNVKATWLSAAETAKAATTLSVRGTGTAAGNPSLGGQGPAHVIADDAELRQPPGGSSIATFRGHARLWQQANSVTAPVIVLDRGQQTLSAQSNNPAEPVRAVLLSASGLPMGDAQSSNAAQAPPVRPREPSVIRVHGGDLNYSDAERKAVMRAGTLNGVVAETGSATSISNEVELLLLPPGNHAGKDGGSAQVDRMTARGHVVITSDGRRGTGEKLVYTGEDGNYVLTGNSTAPPRMTDAARGNVTGEALIFHSRDDSVTIEGGGGRTSTQTTAPK
jgi:lipopolysaccharide export system protein LptA